MNTITPEIFNQELKIILAEIDSRLSRKAKEYATQDRYHNFVQSGIELNDIGLDVQDSTLFSIFALMTKHLISVKDMLRDIQNGNDDFTSEYVDEKFGDLICYLLLTQVYVKQNYTKQGIDKQEKRKRIIDDLIQDIDDMSSRLAEPQTDAYLCDACKLAGAECDIDCDCNKLPPDVLANGWRRFIGEFCSIFQAVPFLLDIPVSFGENRVALQLDGIKQCKEILEYRHDLEERLRQFYKANIDLEIKI